MVPTAEQLRGFLGIGAGDTIGHNIAHATIEEALENMIASMDANDALNADNLMGAIARFLAITNPTAYTLVFNVIGQTLALKLRKKNPLLAASVSIAFEAAGPGIRRSLENAAANRRPQDRQLNEATLRETLSGWRGTLDQALARLRTQGDAPRQTFVLMAPKWMLRAHGAFKEACRAQITYDDTEAERRDRLPRGAARRYQALRGRAAQALGGVEYMEREQPSELMRLYEACKIARFKRRSSKVHAAVIKKPQVECREVLNQALSAKRMPVQWVQDQFDDAVNKEELRASMRGAFVFLRNLATGSGWNGLKWLWRLFLGINIVWLSSMLTSLAIFGTLCVTGVALVFLGDWHYLAEYSALFVIFLVGLIFHCIGQFTAPVAGDIVNGLLAIAHGINPAQGANWVGRQLAAVAGSAGLEIPVSTAEKKAPRAELWHQTNRRFNMIPLGVLVVFILLSTFANVGPGYTLLNVMMAGAVSFLLTGLMLAWWLLSYYAYHKADIERERPGHMMDLKLKGASILMQVFFALMILGLLCITVLVIAGLIANL